jgi:MAE_28990/MAE_18760-like HEPN
MNVRTVEELTDTLAKDLKSRKREITALKFAIDASRDHAKGGLLRAGFAMLYAHFEGFVRLAGTAYLGFVANRGLQYRQLNTNFVAVSLKSKLQDMREVGKATVITQIIQQLLDAPHDTASFGWGGEVDCRSNLNSEVLGEIACLLGISFSAYELKRQFLDQSLLPKRNDIAHGRLIKVDEGDFMEAHRAVLELIEQFRTDIENAAVTKAYQRLQVASALATLATP